MPEDEWITRYGYLLSVLPQPVADRAHVEAFGELSSTQREGLLEEVAPVLPDWGRAATSDDPEALATLMRDVLPRDAMVHSAIGGEVARRVIGSAPVRAYFAVGVGSVTIDQQPLWVQELIHHESNPIDAGTMHHRKGVNSGHWF
ncbi:MAG: hypothetical protein ACREJT_04790 [Myxococcota bacterium]